MIRDVYKENVCYICIEMFHKAITILLLTAMSLRPAYFVGNVVYYESHLSEIIEKYCENKDKPELSCNGKCHLAKQITPIESSEGQEAILDLTTAFFPVFFQEVSQIDISGVLIAPSPSYFGYRVVNSCGPLDNIDKPPKV